MNSPRQLGLFATAVMTAWVVLVLAGGLEPVGRHFLLLGALRVVLLGALLAFAFTVGVQASRWGRLGIGLAVVGAATNAIGGLGSVVTDGWDYNPFGPGADAAPPWYAYVIGLSAFAFALGSILVGFAGRSGGWPALAAVLGGVLYPMTFVMQGLFGHNPGDLLGHLVWIAPWFALAGALATREGRPNQATRESPAFVK